MPYDKSYELEYVGDGTIWMHEGQPVPPRNLSADEVKQHGGKRALLGSGLYKAIKTKRPSRNKIKSEVNHDGDKLQD